MLRPWTSPTPSVGGFVEHECPRCHREVELPLGALCRQCQREIKRRAFRVATAVAAASTAIVALYTQGRIADDPTQRLVAVIGVIAWFLLSHTVVRRAMEQWHR